ncbi:MAG: signal peptide peptidase SppA [Methyloligellaceae bacterium]
MALQAEMLVERRQLKRRLTLWRLAAILAVIGAALLLLFQNERLAASIAGRPHIARVDISGLIHDDREQQELLQKIAKAGHVKAVILRVNSPGGTASGGEALFETIRDLARKKPVVAVFGTIATSSAYIVGLATDHIVARGNTITGSVGVILQWAEVTELLDKLGIKMREVKSGPLKATPSPFQPLDEASRALTEEMVMEAKNWFLDLVARRRALKPADVPGLVDGRIYSGRQALRHKLIDELGGEPQAVAWLEKERKITPDLSIVDWTVDEESSTGLLGGALAALARLAGLEGILPPSLQAPRNALQVLQLDGLVSLWHPPED